MKGNDHMTAHQTAQQAVVRHTERSHGIRSASPHMVRFLSVSSCQLFGVTPNMSNLSLTITIDVYHKIGSRRGKKVISGERKKKSKKKKKKKEKRGRMEVKIKKILAISILRSCGSL